MVREKSRHGGGLDPLTSGMDHVPVRGGGGENSPHSVYPVYRHVTGALHVCAHWAKAHNSPSSHYAGGPYKLFDKSIGLFELKYKYYSSEQS